MTAAIQKKTDAGARRKLEVVKVSRADRVHRARRSAAKAKAKVKRRKIHWVRLTMAAVSGALLVGLILNIVMGYTMLTGMNQKITALSEEITALEADRDSLAMKLEPFTDPSRIEKLAKERLGMDYPTADQFYTVNANPGRFTSTQPSVNARPAESNPSMAGFFAGLFRR